MHFNPTKEMIFISRLRSFLQNKIERRGLSQNDIYFLRKIYFFEATRFSENYIMALDIIELADRLFGAAVINGIEKGKILFTALCGKGEYNVNLRLFEILVATLARTAHNGATMGLMALDDGVLLSVSGTKLKPNVFYPNAANFYCSQNGRFCVFIPLEKKGAEVRIKNETEYLYDKYSAFNIFNCL